MGKDKTGRPVDIPIGLGIEVPGVDFERRAPIIPPGVISYIYSGEFRTTTKTASFTLSTEMVVLVDTTVCDITLTLPSASANRHKVYYIKNIGTTGHTVTLRGNTPAETIDGEEEFEIAIPYTCITPICDASNWWII